MPVFKLMNYVKYFILKSKGSLGGKSAFSVKREMVWTDSFSV